MAVIWTEVQSHISAKLGALAIANAYSHQREDNMLQIIRALALTLAASRLDWIH